MVKLARLALQTNNSILARRVANAAIIIKMIDDLIAALSGHRWANQVQKTTKALINLKKKYTNFLKVDPNALDYEDQEIKMLTAWNSLFAAWKKEREKFRMDSFAEVDAMTEFLEYFQTNWKPS